MTTMTPRSTRPVSRRRVGAPSVAAAALLATTLSSGGARADEDDERRGVMLDVPLVEAPFHLRAGPTTPGMTQATALTTSFYQVVHGGLGRLVDPYDGPWWQRVGGRLAIVGADLVSLALPLGATWQHEEAHRAVLGYRGVSSFDEVYTLPFFAPLVKVSRVDDADLAALKASRPAEFVRMSTAGFEAGYELATQIEKTRFFYRTRTWDTALLWTLYLQNSLYMSTCSGRGDGAIDRLRRDEGADPRDRDFTGLDCTAFTYDLHRPDEPYAARGTHPSGVGVDRYRRHADLTPAEQRYLRRQTWLSTLNFVDPQLVGIGAFSFGGEHGLPWRWNTHLRHMPTPFGSVIDVDVFAQRSDLNLFASVHSYLNDAGYFPGVTAEVQRFPLDLVIGLPVSATARAGAWLQPRGQSFTTRTMAPGGLLGLRLGYGVTREIEPYVEVEAKTAGWSAGSVALDPAFVTRLGLVAPLL